MVHAKSFWIIIHIKLLAHLAQASTARDFLHDVHLSAPHSEYKSRQQSLQSLTVVLHFTTSRIHIHSQYSLHSSSTMLAVSSLFVVAFAGLASLSGVAAVPTSEATQAHPEVIPGPGLPSLAELGITSEQLYAKARATDDGQYP